MRKLTLTVDPEVVKQAEIYAASQQQSLSKLVENFLKTLPQESEASESTLKLTGAVADLAGVINEKSLSDEKQNYVDFIQEKYRR